jgi:acetyl esterase/lipase
VITAFKTIISGFAPRRLPRLIAGGGVMFLLSGCFMTVLPDAPVEDIPDARKNCDRYYRLDRDDSFSCMRIHLPPRKDKTPVPAVVIFPGGAYGVLALDKEGNDYARFLNRHGVAGIVVKYPLGSIFGHFRRHPDMLDAARRAIRLTRYYAPQLGIDPHRVGVMGSSAGGHLAGLTVICGDTDSPRDDDPVSRQSGRPDFVILCYPVVTLEGEYAHKLSRSNLLGGDPPPELCRRLSLERNLPADCPPVFVWTTEEDRTVDPENTRMLATALEAKHIPHRELIYRHGPHGMGLLSPAEAEKYPETAEWSGEMLKFLRDQGILSDTSEEK